ncbi:unnamed protein product [Symbiodinium natans]|uniref:Uncharacterized protein n=1 Tax=Symbiodinium natans TaxID=878477 RepID=A0A812UZ83_9DINO|nr:unnamed protein product [Symbiodinium natans]
MQGRSVTSLEHLIESSMHQGVEAVAVVTSMSLPWPFRGWRPRSVRLPGEDVHRTCMVTNCLPVCSRDQVADLRPHSLASHLFRSFIVRASLDPGGIVEQHKTHFLEGNAREILTPLLVALHLPWRSSCPRSWGSVGLTGWRWLHILGPSSRTPRGRSVLLSCSGSESFHVLQALM